MGSDRPTRGALTVTREIRGKIENVLFFSRYREKLKETFLSSAELSRFRTLFFAVGDFGGTCLDTYLYSALEISGLVRFLMCRRASLYSGFEHNRSSDIYFLRAFSYQ